MAPRNRIQLETARDFTGGLNLASTLFNLQKNETFDVQNVDFDRRGGFGLRRGSKAFITSAHQRNISFTAGSRTANVVTVTGLSPANGDATGGLKPGHLIVVDAADNTYDGTFTVATAVNGATTATWAQVAADDAASGAGTIVQGFGSADSGYTYVDNSANRHILVARGGSVQRWDGSFWQDVIAQPATSGRVLFAEMNNTLYLLRPNVSVPYKWTGSGLATQLTTAVGNYNDNLTSPNQGNFPPCLTMCTHHEVMWAANVIDTGAVNKACRVRWSFIAEPEDWRTNDFIDIDADDENGVIRALVPFGDRLLVFKDKAIYAINGYPPSGFTVQNLTKDLGAPSQWAVRATENAVYFWDVDKGLWKFDGKEFSWVFEPMFPLIDDNKINTSASFQVIVEFHNDRVWLSVPMLAPPYAGTFVSLVYAPNVGQGAWTIHTKTLFGWWVHRGSIGGDLHLLGGDASNSGGYLMELDVENLFTDQKGVQTPTAIVAWYTTRWFDASTSAMKKRWKRPVFVVLAGQDQRTVVEVLSDYDPTRVTKSFDILTTLDGTEGTWDVDNWDAANWAAETVLGAERAVVVRGSPLGSGVAKALRMRNTTIGQDWRFHGLTMKWIPRAIRN